MKHLIENHDKRRFVLVDRDGTVIVERNYLADPGGVELLPGAAEGLRAISDAGFGLLLVTNQSGIGRGYFDETTLTHIHRRMSALLADAGVVLDGIYYCPHAPADDCPCRKPRTGLVELAAREHGFDPRESYVVGDNVADIDLGRNLGATTILVRTGYGSLLAAEQRALAHHVVADLGAAASLIIQLSGSARTNG